MKTIELTTDDELQEFFSDAEEPNYFARDTTGASFVIFATEDGDYLATRPAWEDDRQDDGTYPDGVTASIDDLSLPVTIFDVSGPSVPEPERISGTSFARWSTPDGLVVADSQDDREGVYLYLKDPEQRRISDPDLLAATLQAAVDEHARQTRERE